MHQIRKKGGVRGVGSCWCFRVKNKKLGALTPSVHWGSYYEANFSVEVNRCNGSSPRGGSRLRRVCRAQTLEKNSNASLK